MPAGGAAPLYEDSRRLFGASLWLDAAGVILDAALDERHAEVELAAWRERLAEITAALGWRVQACARRDGPRAALAVTAPFDALFTATLVNEWAWMRAATNGVARALATTSNADELLPAELAPAVDRLRALLVAEENPALRALASRAAVESVPLIADDERVSVGYGAKGKSWPTRALPDPDAVAWDSLSAIPVALVTGSNGKTTTTRLVAAMLARDGHTVGFSCSDGVFIAGARVETGDWSGPDGARRVLRDPQVTAAVLEVARGGLLRRGLVVPHATAAIVTNVAEDHFGGYGIHSRADLAAVKLCVAHALGSTGTLVLNGDDETLRATSPDRGRRLEWFSAEAPPESVPPADEMPITHGGAAAYNVMNAIGAAHVARALGVGTESVRQTLRAFGSDNADNPGRLERFDVGGVRVWIDYAHNPHGLAALLNACRAEARSGRLGLLLGQAGDRDNDAIRALARTAWTARPDCVVLKDLDGYLRGREPGEVPGLLCAELLAAGAPGEILSIVANEVAGVRALLDWSRAGDLLVLLVHALDARHRAIAWLEELRRSGWMAPD